MIWVVWLITGHEKPANLVIVLISQCESYWRKESFQAEGRHLERVAPSRFFVHRMCQFRLSKLWKSIICVCVYVCVY